MPKTKEEKAAYMKEYYLKNKEKICERTKQYKLDRPEYMNEYREKNKGKIAVVAEKYRKENKEKLAKLDKDWRNTPSGKKNKTIRDWKRVGIKSDNYDILYDNYLKETNCEECGVVFGKYGDGTGTFKCADHDHSTGLFRNFLCCKCNIKRG